MKTGRLILFIFISGAICVSCKKDRKNPSQNLLGIWHVTHFVELKFSGQQVFYTDTMHLELPDYFILEIKENNELHLSSFINGEYESEKGYYHLHGNQISIREAYEEMEQIHTYVISGNKLHLTRQYRHPENNDDMIIQSEAFLKR